MYLELPAMRKNPHSRNICLWKLSPDGIVVVMYCTISLPINKNLLRRFESRWGLFFFYLGSSRQSPSINVHTYVELSGGPFRRKKMLTRAQGPKGLDASPPPDSPHDQKVLLLDGMSLLKMTKSSINHWHLSTF